MHDKTTRELSNRKLLDLLVTRAQAGDHGALTDLIDKLENIIRAQARMFIELFRFSTVEDLEQEARLAIIERLHECRINKGSAYGFFKTVIRWRLSDALRREQYMSISVNANSSIRNASRRLEETENENDMQAIADASGFSVLAATRYQQATRSGVVSLDASIGDNAGKFVWHDVIAGDAPTVEDDVLDGLTYDAMVKELYQAITRLPEHYQEVVHMNLQSEPMRSNSRRMRFRQAKARLREMLKEHAPPPSRAYRGVEVVRRGEDGRCYYYAKIRAGRKPTHIGSFRTEREAALAYDRAALQYHQKPKLNFPQTVPQTV